MEKELSELDISEKLCDIACKLNTLEHQSTNSHSVRQVGYDALFMELASLTYCRLPTLTLIQYHILIDLFNLLKEKVSSKIEKSPIFISLGRDVEKIDKQYGKS